MWRFIRRKLGLHLLGEDLMALTSQARRLELRIEGLARNIEVHNGMMLKAQAQILSKIDPNYHKPQIEPTANASLAEKHDWEARKAESDRIGAAALNRLHADDAASKKYRGE